MLADVRQIKVRNEILLATGALKSPHLLQLSGIGPASLLASPSIPLIHDSPSVETNYFDHFALFQVFKLRGLERGLSLGHLNLADLTFMKGMLVDCIVNEALPTTLL